MDTCRSLPQVLYHRSPVANRESILAKGLIGGRNLSGHWCIYLSENRDTWKSLGQDMDIWKVSTYGLCVNDFSSVDQDLDEFLYWGKTNGIISIPPHFLSLLQQVRG